MAKKNRSSIDDLFEYGVDTEKRIIYMGSNGYDFSDNQTGVDYLMAEKVIKGLIMLDSSAPKGNRPITIVSNNPGGSVYDGLAIYDALRTCKNHIIIMNYGYCMSMGSIICQGADVRIMAENCTMMVHDGQDGYFGHTQNFIKTGKEAERLVKLIDGIYLERMLQKDPNFNPKKLRKMLHFDTYLTAQQAVDLGLADKVLKNGKFAKFEE